MNLFDCLVVYNALSAVGLSLCLQSPLPILSIPLLAAVFLVSDYLCQRKVENDQEAKIEAHTQALKTADAILMALQMRVKVLESKTTKEYNPLLSGDGTE